MKLYIKQSVFSIGERFYVKDENGTDVYYVEGSFFEIPKKFKIYDMAGKQVASIEKQMFRLLERYNIEVPGRSVTLKREFTFFFKKFSLEGTNWQLEGDFFAHEYRLISGHNPIMSLSKHWFTWGDSYELDMAHEADALLCLCIVIAVDAVISNEE